MDNEQLLPKSIEMRALDYMEQGIDATEAVTKAFEDEKRTLEIAAFGVDMKTGRYVPQVQKTILEEMCKRVYNRINQPLIH